MFPKQKTPRDVKFLKFLRTLPCCKCGSSPPNQSHHTETGGMALVGSDYSAVPLCLSCHQTLHQHHGKSGYWNESELDDLKKRLMEKYLKNSVDKA